MERQATTTSKIAQQGVLKPWNRYMNSVLASEISECVRYYDRLIQWRPRSFDSGYLLEKIQCRSKESIGEFQEFPDLSEEYEKRTAVLLNGTFNHHLDIQLLLSELKVKLSRSSRVVLNCYNPYLGFVYRLATHLGFRRGEIPSTFVTQTDVKNLSSLSGFEVVRVVPSAYCPWKLFGVGHFLNRFLASVPVLRWFSFAQLIVLRPVINEQKKLFHNRCYSGAK